MHIARNFVLSIVVGATFFGAASYAQQQTTLANVLERGGKKLTKVEMRTLVSGATIEGTQGGNFPNTTFKNVYSADGTVRGDAWNKGAWFTRINGKWSVNEEGQLCSELRNDQGSNIVACQTYYVVGSTYYAARGDTPSSEVND